MIKIECNDEMQVSAYQLKALELTIQLSHCNTSQHMEGALELVVNCIPWRQKIHEGKNNNDDNDDDNDIESMRAWD